MSTQPETTALITTKLEFRIVETGVRCGWDIITPDGRRFHGLCWDEMLGRIAALTMPKGLKEIYQGHMTVVDTPALGTVHYGHD